MTTDRSALPGLIDLVFRNPFITVATVQRALEVSDQTASNLIRKAEGLGWLRLVGRWGRGGRQRWVATEVFQAVASDLDTEV